jgi:hypothetical protein
MLKTKIFTAFACCSFETRISGFFKNYKMFVPTASSINLCSLISLVL